MSQTDPTPKQYETEPEIDLLHVPTGYLADMAEQNFQNRALVARIVSELGERLGSDRDTPDIPSLLARTEAAKQLGDAIVEKGGEVRLGAYWPEIAEVKTFAGATLRILITAYDKARTNGTTREDQVRKWIYLVYGIHVSVKGYKKEYVGNSPQGDLLTYYWSEGEPRTQSGERTTTEIGSASLTLIREAQQGLQFG